MYQRHILPICPHASQSSFPLDHDFRMCPSVFGEPYYLQKEDAEKKARRQKSTQQVLALARERNKAQVKFAAMTADTISFMRTKPR